MKLLIIIFSLFASLAYGQTISISTGEWSPWVSKNIKDYGLGAKHTKDAFKELNIEVKFNFYPWKRVYLSAKTLQNDATGFWLKTKEREKDFYFSKPVFSIKNRLVFRSDKNIKYDSIEDLKNYKVAITRGYSYTNEIDEMIKNNEIDTYVVNNDLSGLKQLLKKQKFDVFLCSYNVAKNLISNNFSKTEAKMFSFSKDVFSKDVFLMVSKKHKDHKDILNKFNEGLEKLKEKSLNENN